MAAGSKPPHKDFYPLTFFTARGERCAREEQHGLLQQRWVTPTLTRNWAFVVVCSSDPLCIYAGIGVNRPYFRLNGCMNVLDHYHWESFGNALLSLCRCWDSWAGGGDEEEVACGLGEAGRGKYRRGLALRRPGLPNQSRTPQKEDARGQRGESAQCPGWVKDARSTVYFNM